MRAWERKNMIRREHALRRAMESSADVVFALLKGDEYRDFYGVGDYAKRAATAAFELRPELREPAPQPQR